MASQVSLTDALGLPEGAARVYTALLDRSSATLEELADACQLPVTVVAEHVKWLREHGLMVRAKDTASAAVTDEQLWAASDPGHALRELIQEREQELLEVRKSLPELQHRFHQARRLASHQVFEHVEGWENIGNRYHQLLRDAVDDIALWDHHPYTPGAPTEESALDRGVRFRVLCDPTDFPDQLGQEFTALGGLEARFSPDVPFRGVIVDRRIAMVSMDREPQNLASVVLRPSPMLDAVIRLYEAQWSHAVPIGASPAPLAEPELQVLTLLASGLKDEAVARQTGTTTRTVRRRVQAVLTALGAKSRFHAGVEAHRRKWV